MTRRRDKNNKRFRFAVVESEDDAKALIKAANGSQLGEFKIYLSFAGGEMKGNQSRTTHSTESSSYKSTHFTNPMVKVTKSAIEITSEKSQEKESSSRSDYVPPMENVTFSKELENSVILKTVNMESVESVSLIVEGLGFHDVLIQGISRTTFIAYFQLEENLHNVDLKFLEIGFKDVRCVGWRDLIPQRRAWVECRGLPANFWSEENFDSICSKIGKIIDHSPVLDVSEFYQTPFLFVETSELCSINEVVMTKLGDEEWPIKLVEQTPPFARIDRNMKSPRSWAHFGGSNNSFPRAEDRNSPKYHEVDDMSNSEIDDLEIEKTAQANLPNEGEGRFFFWMKRMNTNLILR